MPQGLKTDMGSVIARCYGFSGQHVFDGDGQVLSSLRYAPQRGVEFTERVCIPEILSAGPVGAVSRDRPRPDGSKGAAEFRPGGEVLEAADELHG